VLHFRFETARQFRMSRANKEVVQTILSGSK